MPEFGPELETSTPSVEAKKTVPQKAPKTPEELKAEYEVAKSRVTGTAAADLASLFGDLGTIARDYFGRTELEGAKPNSGTAVADSANESSGTVEKDQKSGEAEGKGLLGHVELKELADPAAKVWSFGKNVSARMTSKFGDRIDPLGHGEHKNHLGVDLGAPEGTPVYATLKGKIRRSYWSVASGNVVELETSDGKIFTFHHGKVPGPKGGTEVNPGDCFFIVGHTGKRQTGSHLHFGLLEGDHSVNPAEFISRTIAGVDKLLEDLKSK